MGVGAIFISTLALHRLPEPRSPAETQQDILATALHPVVGFVVLVSIIIHGLSVPLLGFGNFRLSHTDTPLPLYQHDTVPPQVPPATVSSDKIAETSGAPVVDDTSSATALEKAQIPPFVNNSRVKQDVSATGDNGDVGLDITNDITDVRYVEISSGRSTPGTDGSAARIAATQ